MKSASVCVVLLVQCEPVGDVRVGPVEGGSRPPPPWGSASIRIACARICVPRGEPACVSLGVQRGVRNRVPEQEREPRRHLVAGQLEGRALRPSRQLGERDERRRRQDGVQNRLRDLVGRPRRRQGVEAQEARDFRGRQGPAERLATERLDGVRQAVVAPPRSRSAHVMNLALLVALAITSVAIFSAALEVAVPRDVRQRARRVLSEERGRRLVAGARQGRDAEQILRRPCRTAVASCAGPGSSPGCRACRRTCRRRRERSRPCRRRPWDRAARVTGTRTSGVAGAGTSGIAGTRTSGTGARTSGAGRRGAAANLPGTGGQAGCQQPKDAKRPTRLDCFCRRNSSSPVSSAAREPRGPARLAHRCHDVMPSGSPLLTLRQFTCVSA